MARTLSCDYNFELPNFAKVTDTAKDFISRLLVLEAEHRLTADQCLAHPWLTDNRVRAAVMILVPITWPHVDFLNITSILLMLFRTSEYNTQRRSLDFEEGC